MTFVVGSYDDDDDDVVKLKALSIFYPKNPTTRKIERSLSLLFFVSDTLNVKNAKSVCDRWHLSLSLSLSFQKKRRRRIIIIRHIYIIVVRASSITSSSSVITLITNVLSLTLARACARSIKNNRALVQPPPRVYFFENRIFKREEEEKRISSGIFRFQTHPNRQQTNVR